MRQIWMYALVTLLLGIVNSRSYSQRPAPLDAAVDQATTIIVGTLEQYISEPEAIDRSIQERARTSDVMAVGNVEMMVMRTINPRGTYVFNVLSVIKGTSPKSLAVRLPRVTADVFTGDGARSIPLKGRYLLMLTGSDEKGYSQVYRGLIQISKGAKLPATPAEVLSTGMEVTGILIESMELEPNTAGNMLAILKGTADQRVVEIMRKRVDDPDDVIRQSALECLALNQDVTVIPKIAGWKYTVSGRGGNPVINSFSLFTTPEAIPYFNQLLLDTTTPQAQRAAASALRQLPPDKSSIPFWIAVLQAVPISPTSSAVYDAYNSLHKHYPSLGTPKTVRDFNANREAEVKELLAWWADEQAGKHARPADQK